MKQIINGKKYDTTTATEICVGFFGNFNCKKVTLYQKQNGEFLNIMNLVSLVFVNGLYLFPKQKQWIMLNKK